MAMELTRGFKDLVRARVAAEPAFAAALLGEGVSALLAGDVEVGRSLLRDHIAAMVGFEAMAEATGMEAKSLIGMFDPHGDLEARTLFGVIGHLQKLLGIALHVRVEPG